jgi:hypothetical protein
MGRLCRDLVCIQFHRREGRRNIAEATLIMICGPVCT